MRGIFALEIGKIQLDEADLMVEDVIAYRLVHHLRDLVARKTERAVLQQSVVLFHPFQVRMDAVEVESHLDNVANTRGVSGADTSGQRHICAGNVQIDLSAHHFGNFYLSVDYAGSSSADDSFFVLDVFRTDTQGNVFADMFVQLGSSSSSFRSSNQTSSPY